ncbi:MAG: hypothetical protein IT580_07660 [Verrucomicrobiales bacterium]|nr:hypothetical protein [Verrucomicrobiales bacterium]
MIESPHPEAEAAPSARPLLGRFLAGAVLALFLMVGLGIYWVWQRAAREQAWRESLQESGALPAPPRPQ